MTSGEQVLRLLRSALVRRIRFSFTGLAGTITVNQTTFERVAAAIESGRIALIEDTALLQPAGLTGAYTSDGNRLYVQPSGRQSRVWDGTVVHEAVHASLDLTYSVITVADNEAAAYLASAMYFVMTGLPIPRYHRDARWELMVRSTAIAALQTGNVDNAAIARLRGAMIDSGYDDGSMGTLAAPTMDPGNG